MVHIHGHAREVSADITPRGPVRPHPACLGLSQDSVHHQLPGRLRLRQRAPAAPATLRVAANLDRRVPEGLRPCVDFPRSSVLSSGRVPGESGVGSVLIASVILSVVTSPDQSDLAHDARAATRTPQERVLREFSTGYSLGVCVAMCAVR